MNIVALVHRRTSWHHSCSHFFLPFMLFLVGCSGIAPPANRAACPAVADLVGEGSTFDAPLFKKLFSVYAETPCGIPVEYYATGSGMGASRLLNQLVDFGATDAPLTDRQLASSPNRPILHGPITLGAVAVSYHLTGIAAPLHLTGEVVASIYLRKATSWDDPAIVRLNAGVRLPHRAIQVYHRSDGSGTTAIFTHYLTQISPIWKRAVGASTTVAFPIGQGIQGNFGVADAIRKTEGSIGYIESSYVASLHLSAGSIENAAGV